jgi:hypothetical protein
MPVALCALYHTLDKKFDQIFFLIGFYDFIATGFGPGRKIGQ